MQTKIKLIIKLVFILIINSIVLIFFYYLNYYSINSNYNKLGSTGSEVVAIQKALKDKGYFNSSITGYYGTETKKSILAFQEVEGIKATGIANNETLDALGISSKLQVSDDNVQLLANILYNQAKDESYICLVAIGAVMMNRVESEKFPDTLTEVVYQNKSFSSNSLNMKLPDNYIKAATEALSGSDPTFGALYYYNNKDKDPETARYITEIGNYRFYS